MKNLEEKNEKIQIKNRQGIRLIPVKDIVQIVACSNYSDIYLNSHERITVAQLRELGFIRIHRSHLINIEQLHSYSSKTNLVRLANGLKAPVSRKHKKGLVEYIQKFENKSYQKRSLA